MKFKKPKFWDYNKPSFLSYLFFPLAIILKTIKSLINLTTKKRKYPLIRTICVGNIYLGGTGKTSLSLKINEILKKKIKTCFIKKYYPDQIDEQKILANHGKLFKSKDRSSSIKEAYVEAKSGELWLCNCFIKKYESSSDKDINPNRHRKLLLSKKDLNKLIGSVKKEGFTIVPISMFFNEKGLVKLNIGLGRGKKKYDKRQSQKLKDWNKSKQRLLKNN